MFQFVKDRLQQQVRGWQGCGLSRSGKEILLKTVAQALPTYVMSLYLLPKDTCGELQRMIRIVFGGAKLGG